MDGPEIARLFDSSTGLECEERARFCARKNSYSAARDLHGRREPADGVRVGCAPAPDVVVKSGAILQLGRAGGLAAREGGHP
jgi:hypothetical protein